MCTLDYIKLKVVLKCEQEAELPPYLGSTLRGALGNGLKKVCCLKDNSSECRSCQFREKCYYTYIFNNIQINSANDTINMASAKPNPYVIEPPIIGTNEYKKGDSLVFNLILIGDNSNYIPHYIIALQNFSLNGPRSERSMFKLEKVFDFYSGLLVYIDGNIFNCHIRKKTWNCNQLLPAGIGCLKVNFITPFRCINEGKVVRVIDFKILMRNIFRRLSMLASFYCSEAWEIDYNAYLEEAKSIRIEQTDFIWYDWERYSSRTGKKIKMGGIIGSFIICGQLGKFIPFIDIASEIHIGKGCTMGLGKYEWQAL